MYTQEQVLTEIRTVLQDDKYSEVLTLDLGDFPDKDPGEGSPKKPRKDEDTGKKDPGKKEPKKQDPPKRNPKRKEPSKKDPADPSKRNYIIDIVNSFNVHVDTLYC